MTDEEAEVRPEIKALRQAVRALEAIPDATERAKVTTEVLRLWPDLHRLVKEIRQQAVITMNEGGMDFPEIGKEIGIDRSRAWKISKGR